MVWNLLDNIYPPLWHERVYLALYKLADTPFHVQGNDIIRNSAAKPRISIFLLSHIGEYASKYSEYESLKFALNSLKNCEYIVNIFTSVISLHRIYWKSTANACQRLPMPYEWLTIIANDANRFNNNSKQMLRLPCECYECLRMLTNELANVTNVLMNDALPLPCHFFTNDANIWWRGCDWYKYGVNMTLGSLTLNHWPQW